MIKKAQKQVSIEMKIFIEFNPDKKQIIFKKMI